MRCKAIILPLLLLLGTGCLYVPAPEHGLLSGRGEIREEDIEFLEVGKTTRADILLRFGEPDWTQNNDTVLVYQWQVAQGYFAVAGGYQGYAGPYPKSYLLLLEFDENGKLLRFERDAAAWLLEGIQTSAERAEKWAPEENSESVTTVSSRFASDYPAYRLELSPDTGAVKDSDLAALSRLKVYVGAFESKEDPVRLGFRTAAFDVKDKEVFLADKTTSETMHDAVAAAWQTAGHELVQSGQDITVTGTVEKFEVSSPVNLLTWDAVGTIHVSLCIKSAQESAGLNIKRHYQTSQAVETLLGPNKKHFEQAVNQSIEDIIHQMALDTELVSGLRSAFD